MPKIKLYNNIAQIGLDQFTPNYEVNENMEDEDAILVRSANLHDIEYNANLKAIARAGAGVNNIDIDTCTKKGIAVFNTPGANSNAVKELVFAGMLLASRDIYHGIEWIQTQKENENIAKDIEKQKKKYAGHELTGKSLGVIGCGAIGIQVANLALRFGMKVYGYDPYVSVDSAWRLSRNIHHAKTADEIYKECDYITIHVPALEDTKGMINKDAMGLMKDGVVILNFARDILVNDDDMIEALASGKVAKYVTDFPNAKIAGVDNVITLPHLGASTEESEDNCAVMAVKEIVDFIENGNIKNSVNYPACDAGKCSEAARVCVCHKNIPNMITQFTGAFASKGINVSDMVSKSKGDYAYSVFDISEKADEDTVKSISSIDGVLKVRVIQ